MSKQKLSISDMPDSCTNCSHRGMHDKKPFNKLTTEELEVLSAQMGKNYYKKGQVIFYEGNHPQGLYCIYEGKVKLHKLGEMGKEQIVRFASGEDVIGYRALLSNEPYSATATAIEDCFVCHVPRSSFFEVLEGSNELSCKMISLLTRDLKNSESKIVNITQKPVRERIAEALLSLHKNFGFEEDEKTLSVILTRREIGNIAGVTTETTIRTLSDFSKEGLLTLEGKKIIVNSLRDLIRMAGV